MTFLCSDCKHIRNNMLCVSPSNGVSLVDGKPEARLAALNRQFKNKPGMTQQDASVETLGCGQDAIFFEPKDPPKKVPWWRWLGIN